MSKLHDDLIREAREIVRPIAETHVSMRGIKKGFKVLSIDLIDKIVSTTINKTLAEVEKLVAVHSYRSDDLAGDYAIVGYDLLQALKELKK